jgi:membrane protein implicated in regulation of membrane protease activity
VIVFICLGIVGLMMFLFATMFGGHDHSDMGHDFGGHDAAHDTGPSFFSAFSLAFFLTGFGGAGTLLKASGWETLPSTLIALLAGSCLWALAFFFMSMLHRQQADSTVISGKLVGAVGVVTTAISAESHLGKIQCAACPEELIVRCDEEVAAGARVRIIESAGGIYLVRKC